MSKKSKVDITLLIVTVILLLVGVVMIYSASSYFALENYKDRNRFLTRSVVWALLGGIAMVATSLIKYKFYYKHLSRIFMAVSLLLLVYVLLQPYNIRNVKRWIQVNEFISVQPSEFTKASLILYIAYYLDAYRPLTRKLNGQVFHFFILMFISAMASALVFIEPNKSAGMIIILISLAMQFIYGTNILLLGFSGGIGGFIMYKITGGDNYSAARLTSFLNPFADKANKGWQVIQSMYALSLGGITGVGIGNSIQNKLYIPDVQNDFILGSIGEEFGLVATVGLLLLYAIVIYRCIKISMTVPDIFGSMIAAGVASMIFIHVALNYAVSTSLFPVTGVTLPLVSYGGSSNLVFTALIGIVLNISRYRSKV